jgi:ribosomal protein L40E
MMAKVKPDEKTIRRHTILGVIAIIIWFAGDIFMQTVPDIFYGRYGYLILGGLTAFIAHVKNRNAVAWFAIGTWFVIAGLIVVLVMPKLYDRLCPFCQEGISKAARVCPYCQRDIEIPSIAVDENAKKIKICPKCGKKNRADAWNCEYCNEELFTKGFESFKTI